MSEQHPNGEEIARMLREQGPVEAPPDLADEVMRQVRTEAGTHRAKRRFQFRRSAVLVPALGLAAAAALVVGISHLGNLSSSESSAGGESRAAAPSAGNANVQHSAEKQGVNASRSFVISARAARTLSSAFGLVPPLKPTGSTATPSTTTPGSSAHLSGAGSGSAVAGGKVTLTLRGPQYGVARARLQALASAHARHKNEPSVLVVLRRKP
jgi:hypothetical protein